MNTEDQVGKMLDLSRRLAVSSTLAKKFEDNPAAVMNELGLDALIEAPGGELQFLSSYMEEIPEGIRRLTLDSVVNAFSRIDDGANANATPPPSRWAIIINVLANANIMFNANFSANANAAANANANANANTNMRGVGGANSASLSPAPEITVEFESSQLVRYLRAVGLTDARIRAFLAQVVKCREHHTLDDGAERYSYKFRDRNVSVDFRSDQDMLLACGGQLVEP